MGLSISGTRSQNKQKILIFAGEHSIFVVVTAFHMSASENKSRRHPSKAFVLSVYVYYVLTSVCLFYVL